MEAIAGFTIFLGLPLALMQNVSSRKKGFLNALAIGILVFLIVDVFSESWENASGIATEALAGKASIGDAVLDLLALFGGIAIGLLGLVFYEARYMVEAIVETQAPITESTSAGGASIQPQSLALEAVSAY